MDDVVNSIGGEEGKSRSRADEAFVLEVQYFGGKIILHYYIYIITLNKGASTAHISSLSELLPPRTKTPHLP